MLLLYLNGGGCVVYVMIGATDVGSINLSVKTGSRIRRGDEIGYFAYGGSQLVLMFPSNVSPHQAEAINSYADSEVKLQPTTTPQTVRWADDLRTDSYAEQELMVRVRSAIGVSAQ